MALSREHLAGGGIPPLEYAELVKPGRFWGGPILTPREFPVHPSVFESDFTYTPEFGDLVVQTLPDSIQQDVKAIERKIGKRLDVQLVRHGIAHGRDFYPYNSFRLDYTGGSMGIEYGADLDTWISREQPVVDRLYESPIPSEKLVAYEVDDDRYEGQSVLLWHVHNAGMTDTAQLLIFRNFAILVNNLGLAKLAEQRREATVQVDPKDYYPEWGAGDY